MAAPEPLPGLMGLPDDVLRLVLAHAPSMPAFQNLCTNSRMERVCASPDLRDTRAALARRQRVIAAGLAGVRQSRAASSKVAPDERKDRETRKVYDDAGYVLYREYVVVLAPGPLRADFERGATQDRKIARIAAGSPLLGRVKVGHTLLTVDGEPATEATAKRRPWEKAPCELLFRTTEPTVTSGNMAQARTASALSLACDCLLRSFWGSSGGYTRNPHDLDRDTLI
jgi:hypothetical protein